MNIQRGKMVSGGRLLVPAEFRRSMGLADGDTVVMEMDGGSMRVRPLHGVLRGVQERLRKHLPADVSLSDELIADRRKSADDE